ncbi:cupin domain-containing protein [Pseudorhodobacter sp.]|uniref:cupin domain-containing protein n=1 Tax=Pseudorhodobacter sp. TaxID=1934400 RepID=UPI002647FF96|nr:cupin domain-containing protein [Pseudorhodobacter sp.]MDN5787250.1 cupin domain-containing protein [Pseudorhodobacter sp.]
MEHPPKVAYGHLYVDEDGISHQQTCHLTEFEMEAIQPAADPQWQGRKHHDGATVMVTVLPVGWIGAWHENPKPQWIITLSGAWFVESMDGVRNEFGPGEISFGEDQGCATRGGRTGHRSGTVGDVAAVLMLVQFDHKRDKITPCRFR